MTSGTEFSEEIKQPELSKDVAQELKEVNDAALRPTEKIEIEMEHKDAEDLEKAFIESVPLAQAPERTPADKAAEGTVAPPETLTATQEDLDQGRSAENQNEGDLLATAEVQSVAAEVNIAAPVVTLEGAGADGKVTITEAAEPVTIIDTNDREVAAAETAADGRPGTEGREAIIDTNDREVIIDTNDQEVMAAEAAADGGQKTEDREAIIDTNDGVAIIDTNDGSSTVGIIDSNDREVIIDTNDGGGKVSSGENMDDVLIIDSNDGTSTVGIIDTNDLNPLESEENLAAAEPPTWSEQIDSREWDGIGLQMPDGMTSPEAPDLQMSDGSSGPDAAGLHAPDGMDGPDEIGLQIPDSMEIPDDIGLQMPDSMRGMDGLEGQLPDSQPNPGGLEIGSVEEIVREVPKTVEPTNDTDEPSDELSAQLAQYGKELELQQEDLVDLINSLKAELEEINELGEELADKRANMPEPPSQEDFLREDGSLDEEYYNSAVEVFYETKEVIDSQIQQLLQQIATKQDIITNLEVQITDKQAEIDKTQKDINKCLEKIGLLKKTNDIEDSIVQNIK